MTPWGSHSPARTAHTEKVGTKCKQGENDNVKFGIAAHCFFNWKTKNLSGRDHLRICMFFVFYKWFLFTILFFCGLHCPLYKSAYYLCFNTALEDAARKSFHNMFHHLPKKDLARYLLILASILCSLFCPATFYWKHLIPFPYPYSSIFPVPLY